jgi:hypothetical protein
MKKQVKSEPKKDRKLTDFALVVKSGVKCGQCW